jgi:hypothetical protein
MQVNGSSSVSLCRFHFTFYHLVSQLIQQWQEHRRRSFIISLASNETHMLGKASFSQKACSACPETRIQMIFVYRCDEQFSADT